ncbi:MAG: hypothetical protein KC657_39040 [Myxococcales bacterium]|nr:hypothetical protein [Myxococcales bacterium]
MCRRAECRECNKPTFSGCGMHVEQVLGDVPREERCTCRENARREPSRDASILSRLFGG